MSYIINKLTCTVPCSSKFFFLGMYSWQNAYCNIKYMVVTALQLQVVFWFLRSKQLSLLNSWVLLILCFSVAFIFYFYILESGNEAKERKKKQFPQIRSLPVLLVLSTWHHGVGGNVDQHFNISLFTFFFREVLCFWRWHGGDASVWNKCLLASYHPDGVITICFMKVTFSF